MTDKEYDRSIGWLVLATCLVFLLLPFIGHCEGVGDGRLKTYDPALTMVVGSAMFLAPLCTQTTDVSVMSGWEHGAFGYAWTALGVHFLPRNLNWLSPIIVSTVFLVYRIPQFGHGNDDENWRKCVNEQLGVVGATLVEF